MVGLVWVDRLTLTVPQWAALLVSMAILVWYGVSWKSLFCVQTGLVAAFWNTPLSTDTRLLFQSAAYLQRVTWAQFLTEFAFRDYVKLQPPFYTFWLSRIPVLWLHQCVQAGVAIATALLMREMYGDRAKYLLATPVFLLMSTQPGNDFALFVGLVCVMRLMQCKRNATAATLSGLLFLLKPLMLITVPFLMPRLRGWFVISAAMIAAYYVWSVQYHFGFQQWEFLWKQLLLHKLFGPFTGVGGI